MSEVTDGTMPIGDENVSVEPVGLSALEQRGQAWVKKITMMAQAAQADLEKYVPKSVVSTVEQTVENVIKGLF